MTRYQREYVMDSKVASRLISTVLCGRIVPGVIMHERFDDDRKACVLDVVDGKQRLTTLYTFKRGMVPYIPVQRWAPNTAVQSTASTGIFPVPVSK